MFGRYAHRIVKHDRIATGRKFNFATFVIKTPVPGVYHKVVAEVYHKVVLKVDSIMQFNNVQHLYLQCCAHLLSSTKNKLSSIV